MSITVVTASGFDHLTTLDAVKADLGLEGDEQHDGILARLIAAVSSAVVVWCAREFKQEEVIEAIPGKGGSYLYLARTPIVSIEYVTEDGVGVTDFVIEDAGQGTLWRRAGWDWSVQVGGLLIDQPMPGSEHRQWYKVKYIGGYKLPEEEGRTLPYDVEEAVIAEVRRRWEQRDQRVGVSSEAMGDTEVRYFEHTDDGTIGVRAAGLLSAYRRL